MKNAMIVCLTLVIISNAWSLPDIAITEYSYSPDHYIEGETLNVSFKVENLGDTTAIGFDCRCVISGPFWRTCYEPCGIQFSYEILPSLAPGDTFRYEGSIILNRDNVSECFGDMLYFGCTRGTLSVEDSNPENNFVDLFFETGGDQFINILSPAVGDTYQAGDTCRVDLEFCEVDWIGTRLSIDNCRNWLCPSMINSCICCDGYLSFLIPDTSSDSCFLFLFQAPDTCVSAIVGPFTITNEKLVIIDPYPLQFAGSYLEIEWTSTGIEAVNIILSIYNGTTWEESYLVIDYPSDSCEFAWFIPDTLPYPNCRLIIQDSEDGVPCDTSEVFIIITPYINITNPSTPDTSIYFGTTYDITWYSALVSNVDIEYSTNNGLTWISPPIVEDYPASSGSYTWEVPVVDGVEWYCKIRICDSDDCDPCDTSEVFSIIENLPAPIATDTLFNIVDLSWSPIIGAEEIRIWIQPEGYSYYTEFTVDGSETEYYYDELTPGTNYNFKLEIYFTEDTLFSEELNVTTKNTFELIGAVIHDGLVTLGDPDELDITIRPLGTDDFDEDIDVVLYLVRTGDGSSIMWDVVNTHVSAPVGSDHTFSIDNVAIAPKCFPDWIEYTISGSWCPTTIGSYHIKLECKVPDRLLFHDPDRIDPLLTPTYEVYPGLDDWVNAIFAAVAFIFPTTLDHAAARAGIEFTDEAILIFEYISTGWSLSRIAADLAMGDAEGGGGGAKTFKFFYKKAAEGISYIPGIGAGIAIFFIDSWISKFLDGGCAIASILLMVGDDFYEAFIGGMQAEGAEFEGTVVASPLAPIIYTSVGEVGFLYNGSGFDTIRTDSTYVPIYNDPEIVCDSCSPSNIEFAVVSFGPMEPTSIDSILYVAFEADSAKIFYFDNIDSSIKKWELDVGISDTFKITPGSEYSILTDEVGSVITPNDIYYWNTLVHVDSHEKTSTYYLAMTPNPFNSSVSISSPDNATIEIYDVLGQSIDKLPGGDQIWKPEASVGSGVYLVRAKIENKEVTKRVVYLK